MPKNFEKSEILSGPSDYVTWKTRAMDFLITKDLFNYCTMDPILPEPEQDDVVPNAADVAEFKSKDAKALAYLRGTVSNEVCTRVSRQGISTKEFWDACATLFNNNSTMNRMSLLSQYHGLKMSPNETIHSYVARAKLILSALSVIPLMKQLLLLFFLLDSLIDMNLSDFNFKLRKI